MSDFLMQDMESAGEAFELAYAHTLSQTPTPELQSKITGFVFEQVMSGKPYLLVTAEGVAHVMNRVFMDPDISDFVLRLQFGFLARWGQSNTHLEGLVAAIASGVSIDSPRNGSDVSAIPKDLSVRMSNTTSAVELLLSNKWLVVILMLHLFVVPQKQ